MHFPKRLPLLQAPAAGSAVPGVAFPSPVTASLVSEKIDMTPVAWWSAQAKWNTAAGTLAGTLTFEASNVQNPDEAFASADWTTLSTNPGTISVTSGVGNALVRGGPDAFLWLRAKFTFTSGSGVLTINYVGRGMN